MKIKALLLLALLMASSCAYNAGYRQTKQQRNMMPEKVNKRNKKNLKKWGIGTIVIYQEVNHG